MNTDWPSLHEIMEFRSNGIVTYRDDFAYDTTRARIERKIINWLAQPLDRARMVYGDSQRNKAGPAYSIPFNRVYVSEISYRPLDKRYLYLQSNYVDRPRLDLQAAWGPANLALISLSAGTGTGPAVWCHGLLPDQHSFRGSFGGWVFPLINHNAEGRGHYITPELTRALALAYGQDIPAREIFDAILCLLSARSYTTRFAHDLEDDFPQIPFPSEFDVFREAARIGGRIRLLETFADGPRPAFRQARLSGEATVAELAVPTPADAFTSIDGVGTLFLQPDRSLRVSGVSERAWAFNVSGYRVIYRWLRARNGENLAGDSGTSLLRGVLDVIGRVEELISLFDEADGVLERSLRATLTRAAIDLPPKGHGAVLDAQEQA